MNGAELFIVAGIVLWLVAALPIFIAFARKHPSRWLIFIVTIVFGATLIGWLVALVWSLHGFHRSEGGTAPHGGESGLNLFGNDEKAVRLAGPLGAEPVAALEAPSASRNIAWAAGQIERLGQLRAEGHLDEAEYARLKAGVLAEVGG
ncbi:superinfection immunity protein [Pararhizobium mangrovi]|uniref:Superinfection immunity protein n=1 Tax=Pararhizobium mangrovi TaxID=2590452 RepID=A0A506TZ39_9HYPH|nr:superinfection immunity protein [Pararhizobium mangrovi]TPW25994.1 superinfection immunity protein [Pararhizobium mangrovi]